MNDHSKNSKLQGDFSILLSYVVLISKFVSSTINKASLNKLIGIAGETNVQGEEN